MPQKKKRKENCTWIFLEQFVRKGELTIWRFERAFQKDIPRFNLFSYFLETTFERVRMQFLLAGMASHVN